MRGYLKHHQLALEELRIVEDLLLERDKPTAFGWVSFSR